MIPLSLPAIVPTRAPIEFQSHTEAQRLENFPFALEELHHQQEIIALCIETHHGLPGFVTRQERLASNNLFHHRTH